MGVRTRVVRNSAVFAIVALAATVTARDAAAEPVTLNVRVALTYTFGDFTAFGGAPLAAGDTVSGTLVYDPSAPVLWPDQAGFAQYRPAGSLTLGIGTGLVLPLDGMIVAESYFVNGILQQAFVGASGSTDDYPGFDFIRSELEFRGGDRKGTALPTSATDFLTRYPDGFIRFAAWQTGVNPPFDSGTQEFFGRVEPAPVPEPGTLLLAGAGLAMLTRRRRRSAANSRVTCSRGA